MHGLRVALGACLLFTAPALAVAQPLAPGPTNVRTIPPFKRAIPPTPPRFPHRANRPFNVTYPVFIDGNYGDFGNRYLVTPVRREQPKPSKNGEDVFETHSSNDALYAR
jgi:hypothetical protein